MTKNEYWYNWLKENVGYSGWYWAGYEDDFGMNYYIKIEDEELAIIFRLKFGRIQKWYHETNKKS